MIRIVCVAAALQILVVGSPSAQQSTPLKIRGDTTGAPRGCSAASGISAIKAWFAAFGDADSAALARASSTPHGRFVFSMGKFATSNTLFRARTFEEMLAYARQRAPQRERITVQEVRFNGWSGRVLQWDRLYFTRSGNDLGDTALPGVGLGGYWCGQGVWYMHLSPRPDVDPGASPTDTIRTTMAPQQSEMMTRISEIEIEATYLDEYRAILKEEAAASVRLEPGVIAIFPMYQRENPTQVRILEVYANREAYESHLQTPHFQRYKATTLKMVKSLKLVDMGVMDAKTMTSIFRKIP